MKKTISILMILLFLAVACIGFVACDEDEPSPDGGNDLPSNNGNTDNEESMGVFRFARENEFSFGKFVEDKIIAIGNREKFGQRYDEANTAAVDPDFEDSYALTLEDDIFYSATVARLQEKYDHYRNTDLGANLRQISFGEFAEREVGALNCGVYKRINVKVESLSETSEKTVQKGEYTIYFDMLLTRDSRGINYDNRFEWLGLDIWCTIYKEGEARVFSIGFLIEFLLYNQPIVMLESPDHINNLLTQEDKLYIADGYFSAIEEIITAWLDDPRGRANLEEYYG